MFCRLLHQLSPAVSKREHSIHPPLSGLPGKLKKSVMRCAHRRACVSASGAANFFKAMKSKAIFRNHIVLIGMLLDYKKKALMPFLCKSVVCKCKCLKKKKNVFLCI